MVVKFDKKSNDRISLTDLDKLSKNLKVRLDNLDVGSAKTPGLSPIIKSKGFMGAKKTEAVPIFNQAECETIYQGQNNNWIVFGRDRPGPIGSGYGGIGADAASSIDLVVGRAGREARNVDENDATIVADNDFKSDSARIYISERTDIDINFGIVPGRVGNPTGRSGIGIKADNVRILAREGIKFVTRPDDTNSKGGKTDVVLGVDIIAGDDDSDLQPMVKGDNLVQLLKYMIDDSRRLAQMIHSISLSQASLEAMLTAHTHVTGGAAGPGVAIPSIEMGIFCATSQIKRLICDIPSQITQTFNNIAEEIEFLEVYGPRYINSRSNHVN
tara:strand:+ start:1713 stop:2699 length:987 start_codon:yes stop_codon:yes gene_type:complete